MNGEYGESDVETGLTQTNIAAEIGYSPVPVAEQDKLARVSALFNGITGLFNSAVDVYDRVKYRPRPTGNVADTNRSGTNALDTDQAALFGGRSPFDSVVQTVTPILPLLMLVGGVLVITSFARGK